MLRDAYRLRKNVNSLTRLARTLSDCGPEGKLEAQRLLDEASRLWPKNPAVPFRVSASHTRGGYHYPCFCRETFFKSRDFARFHKISLQIYEDFTP